MSPTGNSVEAGVSTRALRPPLAGLERRGFARAEILREVGLTPGDLDDPDARVPHRLAIALWDLAVARTGDADFGLHVAQALDVATFDVQAYAFLGSPNLGEGLARLARYQRLNHDAAQVTLERTDAHAILRHLLPPGAVLPRAVAEFVLATAIILARHATGTDVPLHEVRLAHAAPADVTAHARVFAAPVRFAAGENALVFPEAALALPHVKADAGLLRVLERHADERLAALPTIACVADRVRALLGPELRGGNPSAEHVAERLGWSVRTLSRRLADEGTSHKDILDALRSELAARYLADPNLGIGEVAFLLGFSEASAFHRAFRRWTGRTPLEQRRLAQP